MLQDQQGFLWMGTLDGLNRFDGYRFVVYKHDPDDPGSLSDSWIQALSEDRQGNLWVGTSNQGLCRLDRETERFTRYQHDPARAGSLSHNRVLSILVDRQGLLWVGTDGGGLNHFDSRTGRFTHYRHDPADPTTLRNDRVFSLAEDQQGYIWAGTAEGPVRLDPKTGRVVNDRNDHAHRLGLRERPVRAIIVGADGSLWFGSEGGGVYRFDPQTERFQHYPHDPGDADSLSSDLILSLMEDPSGILWVGTNGGGLSRLDLHTQRLTAYRHKPSDPASLSDNAVRSIIRDRGGILWVGTASGGLNRFDPYNQRFELYRHIPNESNSLSGNWVREFEEDDEGNIWIGLYGDGFNRFNPDTRQFTHYRHDPDNPAGLSNNNVYTIEEDRRGILWIGTAGGGLNRFDPDTELFTHYRNDPNNSNSLSNDQVYTIEEDREGALWIGTAGGGLNRFHPQEQRFEVYRHDSADPAGLSHDQVMAVKIGRDGTPWIGTYQGLDRFDRRTGSFVHYGSLPDDPHGLSYKTILCIEQDPDSDADILWIGTLGGGLNRLDVESGRFRSWREKDGLPNDSVYGILFDDRGNLWMSTNQGIARFEPASQSFTTYDVSMGLQSNEFTTGSYLKSRDGRLFFGGPLGFNIVDTQSLSGDSYHAPIVITDFRLFNQSVAPTSKTAETPLKKPVTMARELTLSHNQFLFSFEFAALHFARSPRIRYAYKMDGVNDDWIETNPENRFANYMNLDGGSYVFRVKATNRDGRWGDIQRILKVRVLPPPWKTWWAYSLYALVLALAVYTFVRSQHRKLAHERAVNEQLNQMDRLKGELNRRLEEKVRERTQALREKNRELQETQKALVESAHEAGMGEIAAHTLHNMGNAINSIHTAAQLIHGNAADRKWQGLLHKIVTAMGEREGELGIIFTRHPKAEKTLAALNAICSNIDKQSLELEEESDRMQQRLFALRKVLQEQQRFTSRPPFKEEIGLNELIEETLTMTSHLIGEGRITVHRDFEPLPTICLERSKLKRALVYLLENACESISRKSDSGAGRITLRTRHDHGEVILEVADDGRGPAPQHLENVFRQELFSSKGSRQLGLHYAANIMAEIDGTIHVFSEGLGKETIVRLVFLLDQVAVVAKPGK
ncbi:MAG: two-component regulator propeller domain-containing protein [Acidobacteriota bacterium]|nr:two-component regulator propeller domain-containing protein [Acidobacteriota bacterium]